MAAAVAMRALTKPDELVDAAAAAGWLFNTLKRWFDVSDTIQLDLSAVSSEAVDTALTDPHLVAATTMRKLQGFQYAASPGRLTAIDVVVTLVDSALRALIEAPNPHLHRTAETCDWDREMEALNAGLTWRNPKAMRRLRNSAGRR